MMSQLAFFLGFGTGVATVMVNTGYGLGWALLTCVLLTISVASVDLFLKWKRGWK